MRRINNWDVQVTLWAIEQIGKPFVWGETDCCSLANQMLAVMYGEPVFDLHYSSLAEATREYRACEGVRPVLGALSCTTLDLIAHANTGDILIASPRDDEPFEAVMPVTEVGKFLFTEPGGLVQILPFAAAPLDAVPYRMPFEMI